MAGLLIVALVAILQFANIPATDRPGMAVFDTYQRAAPRPYEDAAVRVIDIDEESIARIGQWPWPRTEIAKLTDRLAEAGAAAIAFDIVFSEADRTSPEQIARQIGDSDRALAATLASLPSNDERLADSFALSPVVNGLFLVRDERNTELELPSGMAIFGSPPTEAPTGFRGTVQPLPILREASAGLGSLSIDKDVDGVVRKAPLLFLYGDQAVPALSVEALRVAQQAESTMIRTSDGSGETPGAAGAVVSVQAGQFTAPTTAQGELWLHYTDNVPGRTIPAWQILEGTGGSGDSVEGIEGQIVFVGASAVGLRDLVTTPLAGQVPGVMVHAQAAEQMILGKYLTRPDWARGLELLVVIVLGVALSVLLPKLGALPGAIVGLAGIGVIAAGSWAAFSSLGYLLDPTFPITVIVLVYGLQTLLGFYQEERQRSYIRNAFDRYLSPEMVRQIAANPDKLELGGEEREMTVLFCDIRGFSRISEQYEPQEVINFLTGFLTPMCDILLGHKGTVDKFIGDAILAFWNAPLDDPDQFKNGARAALAMNAALAELNQTMPTNNGQVWPDDVQIGIGLNAGLCCVGNMGSQQRLSYSLIGDTVNIASRFEGLTKQYGVAILIGSALADQLDGFALLELDRVKVVGRDAPDTIFALIGDETVAGCDKHQMLSEQHREFLSAYRSQKWADAKRFLTDNAASYETAGLGKLRQIMMARIAELQNVPPPPTWDGVFQATEK